MFIEYACRQYVYAAAQGAACLREGCRFACVGVVRVRVAFAVLNASVSMPVRMRHPHERATCILSA